MALPAYKQLATLKQMDGQSIILWHDAWRGVHLRLAWPHLFSFVKSKNITLPAAFMMDDLTDMHHLPISVEAMAEFRQLQALASEVQLKNMLDG
jgi:hypothetical protein